MAQGTLDHDWENRLAKVQQEHQPLGQAVKHAVWIKVLLRSSTCMRSDEQIVYAYYSTHKSSFQNFIRE